MDIPVDTLTVTPMTVRYIYFGSRGGRARAAARRQAPGAEPDDESQGEIEEEIVKEIEQAKGSA
jgi:hypothetical protein